MLRRLSRRSETRPARPAARRRRHAAVAPEALEARTLLTNTLFLSGSGSQFVGQDVFFEGNADGVYDQVVVTDAANYDFLGFDLPDYGVDVIVKGGATVDSLQILGGAGDDGLLVENGGNSGQFGAVRFDGFGGNDLVSALRVDGAGGVDIDLGAGDDVIERIDSFGGVTIDAGDGNDFIGGVFAETAGVSVFLGDGDDELESSLVGGGFDLFVVAGAGNDRVAGEFRAFGPSGQTGTADAGNVTIMLGDGADHFDLFAAGGNVQLDLGAGNDSGTFNYEAGLDAILDAGAGNDRIISEFGAVSGSEHIRLGTGSDTLLLGGGFVKGESNLTFEGSARIHERGANNDVTQVRTYFGDRLIAGDGPAVITVCASEIFGNYRIAGGNLVLVTDSFVGGSLIVTASGTANLSLRPETGGDLIVRTAGRADRVTIKDAFVGRNLSVDLNGGSDNLRLLRTGVTGNSRVVTDGGNDRVDFRVFSTEGNLAIDTGAGRDRLVVKDAGVGGNFSSVTGDGNDVIVFADFFVENAFRLLAGDGADRLTVVGVEAGGDVILNTGAGKDRVKVRGLTGGAKLVVQTAQDIDKVDVRHVFADGPLTIGVGTANDILFAAGVDNAAGNAMLNGGPDPNDTLRGSFAQNVVRRFETIRARG